jgi:hypothetical protein
MLSAMTATTTKEAAPAATKTEAPGASAAPGPLSAAAAKLRERFLSYLPFRAFTLAKLPLAAFAGLRVRALDGAASEVTVPYGWRSRNPFGSLYFAAHAMAAEMATGALVLLHATSLGEGKLSTLITGMNAKYSKAAKTTVTYRCEGGAAVETAARRALETGEPVVIELAAKGTLASGEVAGEFTFTWSMKRRSSS